MEVTGFGGKGEYTAGHIQLWLKDRLIASLACFHVVKIKVSYHILLGRTCCINTGLVPSTYNQCVKGRLNGRMIRITAKATMKVQCPNHPMKVRCPNHKAPSSLDGRIFRMTQSLT